MNKSDKSDLFCDVQNHLFSSIFYYVKHKRIFFGDEEKIVSGLRKFDESEFDYRNVPTASMLVERKRKEGVIGEGIREARPDPP